MSNLAKATISLMIATMLSKVLGFGRELVLASAYGTSMYSDAYLVALNIPTVIFAAIGTALSTIFIPIYYEAECQGDHIKLTNNILNIVTILSLLVSILGFIFTEELVKIFAMGFKGETLHIAIVFTRILILGIVFISLSEIIKGYLNANNEFTIPGIMFGIPFNIIIIISIIISSKINPYILPIGTLIAIMSRVLFQIPYMKKYGYKYNAKVDFSDKYIKKMIWLLGPVFIGVAVNQINAIVDRTLASTLQQGSISSLNYANKLNGFVLGLFILTIASVIYPILSKLSTHDNKEMFSETISKSINSVILLVLPISVGAISLAAPIVSILFERGAFDSRATNMTAISLVFYSIGMVAFGLRDILGKVFYSLQDTKTPMINGIITMILNIILNIILVKYMGHAGLAFATSISAIICIFLLFNSLKNKIGYFGQDKIIKTTIKSLIASILMGIVTVIAYKFLIAILGVEFIGKVISLFGSIIIGSIIYGIMVVILKVEEINVILNLVRKKLNFKTK